MKRSSHMWSRKELNKTVTRTYSAPRTLSSKKASEANTEALDNESTKSEVRVAN